METLYVLEADDSRPRQYRVAVLRTRTAILEWMMNRTVQKQGEGIDVVSADGFAVLLRTSDRAELMEAIERYLTLESTS